MCLGLDIISQRITALSGHSQASFVTIVVLTDSRYVRMVFWTGDFMLLKAATLPFIARSNANGSLTAE